MSPSLLSSTSRDSGRPGLDGALRSDLQDASLLGDSAQHPGRDGVPHLAGPGFGYNRLLKVPSHPVL